MKGAPSGGAFSYPKSEVRELPQEIDGIRVTMEMDASGYVKGAQQVDQANKKVADSAVKLDEPAKATRSLSEAWEEAMKALTDADRAVKDNDKHLAELGQEVKKQTSDVKKFRTEFDGLDKIITNQNITYSRMEKGLKDLEAQYGSNAHEVQFYRMNMAELEKVIDANIDRFEKKKRLLSRRRKCKSMAKRPSKPTPPRSRRWIRNTRIINHPGNIFRKGKRRYKRFTPRLTAM